MVKKTRTFFKKRNEDSYLKYEPFPTLWCSASLTHGGGRNLLCSLLVKEENTTSATFVFSARRRTRGPGEECRILRPKLTIRQVWGRTSGLLIIVREQHTIKWCGLWSRIMIFQKEMPAPTGGGTPHRREHSQRGQRPQKNNIDGSVNNPGKNIY